MLFDLHHRAELSIDSYCRFEVFSYTRFTVLLILHINKSQLVFCSFLSVITSSMSFRCDRWYRKQKAVGRLSSRSGVRAAQRSCSSSTTESPFLPASLKPQPKLVTACVGVPTNAPASFLLSSQTDPEAAALRGGASSLGTAESARAVESKPAAEELIALARQINRT